MTSSACQISSWMLQTAWGWRPGKGKNASGTWSMIHGVCHQQHTLLQTIWSNKMKTLQVYYCSHYRIKNVRKNHICSLTWNAECGFTRLTTEICTSCWQSWHQVVHCPKKSELDPMAEGHLHNLCPSLSDGLFEVGKGVPSWQTEPLIRMLLPH